MPSLNLEQVKTLSGQLVDLGTAINSHVEKNEKVPYKLTKDIRKAAQSLKVEAQKIRVSVSALNKPTK